MRTAPVTRITLARDTIADLRRQQKDVIPATIKLLVSVPLSPSEVDLDLERRSTFHIVPQRIFIVKIKGVSFFGLLRLLLACRSIPATMALDATVEDNIIKPPTRQI